MGIVKVEGLPPDYRVEVNRKGTKWTLVLPDMDYIHRLGEWDHHPTLEECLRALCTGEK